MIIVYIIIGVIALYGLYRIFGGAFGSWLGTLNQVISSYVANKQLDPNDSEKETFFKVLDGRFKYYPKGIRNTMYNNKEDIKNTIPQEIENGFSIIDKYNLPILIYSCLMIESSMFLDKQTCVEETLDIIADEVRRQGFERFI